MRKAPHKHGAGKEYMNALNKLYSRPRPDTRAIKAAISPADFYQCELPDMPSSNQGGWRDGGLCPFHADNHAGSFRVHLETGAFCCFSCGAKGGDVIAFTMQRDGLSFSDALKRLAEDWGV